MSLKVDTDKEQMEVSIYCPVCGRDVYAENVDDVYSGEHDGFIFVHDNIEHSDDDVEALDNGIN